MKLFTFGTLLADGVDSGWLGDAQRTQATLLGALWRHPSGRPLLQVGGAHEIIGELVHDVSAQQLDLLDRVMGVSDGECERISVQVVWGLSIHAALTYRCPHPDRLGARLLRVAKWTPRGRLHRRSHAVY